MAVDSLVKASTPEPVGPHALWKKRGFHLPYYVQHIANDLREKRGMDESTAIAVALGAVKRWARGGGKVDANTRAAAAKAVAEWEATKARAHSVKSEKNLSLQLAVAHHVKGGTYHWRHGWIPLDAAAKAEKAAFEKRLGHKASGGEMAAQFGHGHQEGVKEAAGVAKHHGFTDAQIAEATKAMTERAKARQAADKERHDRGLTGAQAAEEILAKTGQGKATKDTAHADRAALVRHMREEEKREAAAVGHTGKIRHGGKAPKETTKARPGRKAPARGRQRATKGLSPGIEAQRQELLHRIAAMTDDINARAKGHEQTAVKAHKEGKLHHALRSLGRAVGLRRALHAHHNAAAGVLLGSTTKGAKLRAHLNRAATRQHGKGHPLSGKGFGVAAGVLGTGVGGLIAHGGMGGLPFSNGGSVTQLNFADTEPDADDMMGHVRASVPKGHGMKVPNGTAPAKVAKMHGYLHRRGNAKHTHKGGAMNYSLDFAELTTKARKALPSSAFAYVDDKGDGHFPIHDAAHVRNALSRIGQGAQHADKAKRKVLAAAKRMGIGKAANMSVTDPTVTALDFAARSLPHAQFPRVNTNPRPARGVGKALATYRQPVTSAAHAGDEMFPPRARRGGGPGNSVAPYRQPKSGQKPAGVPLGVSKGSGTMQIYTPTNHAEHSHVMRALRGARALRRQGRTAQANSVMAGLVRQVTGRARKMPNGQMRSHTIREVTTGLAQMAKGVHGVTTSGPTGVHKGPPD